MDKGYCLIVRDYKAEIVEFITNAIISMPDGSKKYFVYTKYGDEYFNESDLSPTKERFKKECEQLNKSLSMCKEGIGSGKERSIYKVRR